MANIASLVHVCTQSHKGKLLNYEVVGVPNGILPITALGLLCGLNFYFDDINVANLFQNILTRDTSDFFSSVELVEDRGRLTVNFRQPLSVGADHAIFPTLVNYWNDLVKLKENIDKLLQCIITDGFSIMKPAIDVTFSDDDKLEFIIQFKNEFYPETLIGLAAQNATSTATLFRGMLAPQITKVVDSDTTAEPPRSVRISCDWTRDTNEIPGVAYLIRSIKLMGQITDNVLRQTASPASPLTKALYQP